MSDNPWIGMWSRPRSTVRALVQTQERKGALILASAYVLQGFFFYANWWSFGIYSWAWWAFAASFVLSPVAAVVWLYFYGWVLRTCGKWLGGSAPMSYLRLSLAWSKIPFLVSLLMWLVFLIASPETVFIIDAEEPSSLFVNFIYLILGVWSFILLVQSVREVQGFSMGRSIANVILAEIVSFCIFFLVFNVVRIAIL